jgi:phosphoribosylaminoimidazole (AIR) synthetase
MYRVFNMGIGMIAILDKDLVSEVQNQIPEKTFVIGELVSGSKKVQLI